MFLFSLLRPCFFSLSPKVEYQQLTRNRRDENVKNVHYILTPKPWELVPGKDAQMDETDRWWWEIDSERRRWEAERGVDKPE